MQNAKKEKKNRGKRMNSGESCYDLCALWLISRSVVLLGEMKASNFMKHYNSHGAVIVKLQKNKSKTFLKTHFKSVVTSSSISNSVKNK